MVSDSRSTIRLNRSAHVPNSSCDVTGTRAEQVAALDPFGGPAGLLDRGQDPARQRSGR